MKIRRRDVALVAITATLALGADYVLDSFARGRERAALLNNLEARVEYLETRIDFLVRFLAERLNFGSGEPAADD